jgi:hypothetical protein
MRPGLHLDDMQGLVAGIAEPMPCANGNVCGVVDLQAFLQPIYQDIGFSAQDDPVLGAVLMSLEREALTRLDDQALDDEALADVKTRVPAPDTFDTVVMRNGVTRHRRPGGKLRLCG